MALFSPNQMSSVWIGMEIYGFGRFAEIKDSILFGQYLVNKSDVECEEVVLDDLISLPIAAPPNEVAPAPRLKWRRYEVSSMFMGLSTGHSFEELKSTEPYSFLLQARSIMAIRSRYYRDHIRFFLPEQIARYPVRSGDIDGLLHLIRNFQQGEQVDEHIELVQNYLHVLQGPYEDGDQDSEEEYATDSENEEEHVSDSESEGEQGTRNDSDTDSHFEGVNNSDEGVNYTAEFEEVSEDSVAELHTNLTMDLEELNSHSKGVNNTADGMNFEETAHFEGVNYTAEFEKVSEDSVSGQHSNLMMDLEELNSHSKGVNNTAEDINFEEMAHSEGVNYTAEGVNFADNDEAGKKFSEEVVALHGTTATKIMQFYDEAVKEKTKGVNFEVNFADNDRARIEFLEKVNKLFGTNRKKIMQMYAEAMKKKKGGSD